MAVESDLRDDGASALAPSSRHAYRRAGALAALGVLLLSLTWSIRPFTAGLAGTDRAPADPVDDAVFCFGLVDFENGSLSLAPLQPGRVAEVLVRENQEVKVGAVLLRLDDRQAKARAAAAAAAVEAAEALAAQARLQPNRLRARVNQQQAAIDAAGFRLSAVQKSLARKRDLLAQNLLSLEEVGIAEEEVKALEAAHRAEQARLAELELQDPASDLRRAEADLAAARASLDQARQALDECALKAPCDGIVLRLFVSPGEVYGEKANKPALLFGPDGPRVIRAEIDQEFARGLRVGQEAEAEDDVRPGLVWKGHVHHVSNWYLPRREVLDQMLYARDTRTLECLITLKSGQPPLRVGQRMRVTIR